MKSTKLLKDFLIALRAELISYSKPFEERIYAFKQNNRVYRTKNRLPLKALKNFNSGNSFLEKKSNIDTLANDNKMTDY